MENLKNCQPTLNSKLYNDNNVVIRETANNPNLDSGIGKQEIEDIEYPMKVEPVYHKCSEVLQNNAKNVNFIVANDNDETSTENVQTILGIVDFPREGVVNEYDLISNDADDNSIIKDEILGPVIISVNPIQDTEKYSKYDSERDNGRDEKLKERDSKRELVQFNNMISDDVLELDYVQTNQEQRDVEDGENADGSPSLKKLRTSRKSLSTENKIEIISDITQTNITKHKPIKETRRRKKNNNSNGSVEQNDGDDILEPVLSCEECSYMTWNKAYMDLHSLIHQKKDEKGVYPCKVCDYVTKDRQILIKHLISHNGKVPFRCILCEFKCGAPIKLIRHNRSEHPEVTRPFSCNVCEYKSAHNSDIIRHTRIHTGEKPFACKQCPYRCTDSSSLTFHMRQHTGEKPFSCNLCEYRSKSNSTLSSHMRRHTGERPFNCKACDFKFANNSDLVRHMKINSGEKPFACQVCDFSFPAKCVLVKHVRTHNLVYVYRCILCDFQCSRSCYLLKHMRHHNGENVYSCNEKLCTFKCDTYVQHLEHKKSHTGKTSFTCEICDHKCTTKQILGRHMKTHTADSQYSCTNCEFVCLRKFDLVKHMRTHIEVKPFSCGHCFYKCASSRTLAKHVRDNHIGKSELEYII